MKIELTREWMGHKPGARLDLMPFTARQMVRDNRAKFVESATADKEVQSPQANKQFSNRRQK